MALVNLINRLVTHSADSKGDFGIRMLMHIPIGIIASIPVLGWGLLYLFKFYEENEDLHLRDEAWKDTYGAIVGYVIGIIVIIILWRLLWW